MYIRQVSAHLKQFIRKHYLNYGFYMGMRIGLAHYKQGGCLIYKNSSHKTFRRNWHACGNFKYKTRFSVCHSKAELEKRANSKI